MKPTLLILVQLYTMHKHAFSARHVSHGGLMEGTEITRKCRRSSLTDTAQERLLWKCRCSDVLCQRNHRKTGRRANNNTSPQGSNERRKEKSKGSNRIFSRKLSTQEIKEKTPTRGSKWEQATYHTAFITR